MSVGTNENEKIIKEINNNLENNVEKSIDLEATQRIDMDATQKFDMQATQRINFLGELKKDTEQCIQQLINEQQGNIASKIQDSSSEISTELIAQ